MTIEIEIRDAEGKVFNKVHNPYAIVSMQEGKPETAYLVRIGEKEAMEEYQSLVEDAYESHQEYYKAMLLIAKALGSTKIPAPDMILVELPRDQEEVDKVFNISGYVSKYVPQLNLN